MQDFSGSMRWFVVLALCLHWLLLVLSIISAIPYNLVVFIGSWSPNIAAFIVLGTILNEPGGIRKLIGGWGKWRVEPVWYLAALSPIAVAFLSIGLLMILGSGGATGSQSFTVVGMLIVLIGTLITGAMGEELGWRGFFLPRLQARSNALIASLVVGVIWVLWHAPLWFVPGQLWAEIPFWAFAIFSIASSVIFAWVVNSTGGSMVMATLMHLSQNVGIAISGMMGVAPSQYTMVSALLYLAYALIVFVVAGSSKLRVESG